MNALCKAITLSVLFLQSGWIIAEDTVPAVIEEGHPVTLEDALKPFIQDKQIKVLFAKTEVLEGKKVHIIKILIMATGHVQHVKVDANTGKTLENIK